MFYFKTNVNVKIYMTKTESTELITPSKKNNIWSTSTVNAGGMTAIEILPSDPNYCVDCQYIGKIVAKENGKINILTQIEHQNEFLEI